MLFRSDKAHVRINKANSELRIDVSDTGEGFEVASGPTTPGSLISARFGLFSLRERMNTIGGRFDIQSFLGNGTTATLILPIASNDRVAARSDAITPDITNLKKSALSPSQTVHSQRCIRVLIVDDHAMVRQGLRTVLDSYADLEVVGEACNGEEAVAMTGQFQPAIVVMDINMPKMNGIEATAHIKTQYPKTVVIGLSVNAGAENRDAMLKAGAALLLTKEAAVRELYDAILDSSKWITPSESQPLT